MMNIKYSTQDYPPSHMKEHPVGQERTVQPIGHNSQVAVGNPAHTTQQQGYPLSENGLNAVHVRFSEHA